ncbi:MAG: hypothetical protein JNJ77_01630 [Planctomycetia bacterium]|nr:hypothetical protein [Planctomycetia bacterium]
MSNSGSSRTRDDGRGFWVSLPALVAFLLAFLLIIVLVYRLIQQNVIPRTTSLSQNTNTEPLNTKPIASVSPQKETKPTTNLTLPPLPEGATLRLTMYEAQDKPLTVNAFLLHSGKQYVVTTASCMSQAEWERVKRIRLASTLSLRLEELQGPPQHLGEHTEDRPVNMLENPDMGKDMADWPLPNTVKLPGLSLAQESSKDQLVWLVGDPMKKPQQLYRCRIMNVNDKIMYLQPLERFDFEELVGLPFIDQQGKVVGILAGGGEFTLVSMSLPAMRRQLEKWQIIDTQKR